MSRPPLIGETQMGRLEPFFLISRGLRRAATARTRRSTTASSAGAGLAVFDRIFSALVSQAGVPEKLMIDSTHPKAHRTAASLAGKGMLRAASDAPAAD